MRAGSGRYGLRVWLGDLAQAHLVTRQPHSANTDAQYYQAIVGDCHTVTAYGTITALQEGGGKDSDTNSYTSMTNCDESSASTPLQKWRSYSTKETQLVREYIADHIARGQTVSLREGAKFIAVHQMDRSEKNIQDNKVKSLLKALPCRLIPSL